MNGQESKQGLEPTYKTEVALHSETKGGGWLEDTLVFFGDNLEETLTSAAKSVLEEYMCGRKINFSSFVRDGSGWDRINGFTVNKG